MISGAFELVLTNEPIPRIVNVELSYPGSPLDCTEMTPAILPWSELLRLGDGVLISCMSIVATAPVRVAFFCSPEPTTTLSSSLVSCSSETSIIVRLPTSTVCGA